MSSFVFWIKSFSSEEDEQQIECDSKCTNVDHLKSAIISQLKLTITPRSLQLYLVQNGTKEKLSPRTQLNSLPAGASIEFLSDDGDSAVGKSLSQTHTNTKRVAWDIDDEQMGANTASLSFKTVVPEPVTVDRNANMDDNDPDVLEFDTSDQTWDLDPPTVTLNQTQQTQHTQQSKRLSLTDNVSSAAIAHAEVRAAIVSLESVGVPCPPDATIAWLISSLNSNANEVMRLSREGLDTAVGLLNCAENICKSTAGAVADLITVVGNIANTHKLKNEFEDAHKRYQMCYQLQLSLDDKSGAALTLMNASGMLMKQKQTNEALKLASDAIGLLESSMADLGVQLQDEENAFPSDVAVELCFSLCQSLRMYTLMCLTSGNHAQAHTNANKALLASRALSSQSVVFDADQVLSYKCEAARCCLDQGRMDMAARQPSSALELFVEAESLLVNSGAEGSEDLAMAANLAGTAYAMTGDVENALKHWLVSKQTRAEYGMSHDAKLENNISTCESKLKSK